MAKKEKVVRRQLVGIYFYPQSGRETYEYVQPLYEETVRTTEKNGTSISKRIVRGGAIYPKDVLYAKTCVPLGQAPEWLLASQVLKTIWPTLVWPMLKEEI